MLDISYLIVFNGAFHRTTLCLFGYVTGLKNNMLVQHVFDTVCNHHSLLIIVSIIFFPVLLSNRRGFTQITGWANSDHEGSVSWGKGAVAPQAGDRCKGWSHSALSSACLLSSCLLSLDGNSWTSSCIYFLTYFLKVLQFCQLWKICQLHQTCLALETNRKCTKSSSHPTVWWRLPYHSYAPCSVTAMQS